MYMKYCLYDNTELSHYQQEIGFFRCERKWHSLYNNRHITSVRDLFPSDVRDLDIMTLHDICTSQTYNHHKNNNYHTMVKMLNIVFHPLDMLE